MKSLSTSLLREKFVIKPVVYSDREPVIALSNRVILELRDNNDKLIETYIIRAHNMHQTVRMAARILTEFKRKGPIAVREEQPDWERLWDSVTSEYERSFNTELWGAIYRNGRPLFQHGEVHPLLDLIEKCDHDSEGEYEDAIGLAEQIFSKAGKDVKIEYDGNVALVVNIEELEARFGIILRGADRTTTFSYSVRTKDGNKDPLNFSQCLVAATAFLEGIQLAFMVGMNNVKIIYGIIERHSREEKQTREGRGRLGRLATEIANLENAYEVRYRPEKPDFTQTVSEAESLAEGIFEPVPEEKTPEPYGFETVEQDESDD